MRCQYQMCKKKILSYMVQMHYCRCNLHFCDAHLQAEYHDCTFDYKDMAAHILKKQLVKLCHQKIIPI